MYDPRQSSDDGSPVPSTMTDELETNSHEHNINSRSGVGYRSNQRYEEQTYSIEESKLGPNVSSDRGQPTKHVIDESAGRFSHGVIALERIAQARKAAFELGGSRSLDQDAHPPESIREWIPLENRDSMDEELNSTLDAEQIVGEQSDLEMTVESRTIHILGIGPAGKYVAQALASSPEAPPVTLLMHNPLHIQQWHEEGAHIQLLKNGNLNTTSNVNVESSSNIQRTSPDQKFAGFGTNLEHTAEPPDSVIDCLIVTTEGHTTIAALSSIKHRLRRTSTICFIQDGLGVASLADSLLFPDPDLRPSYMLGNMSHDLVPTPRKFTLYEKQKGRMFLTMAPRNQSPHEPNRGPQNVNLVKRIDYSWSPTSTYLMRALSRAYELGAVGLPETEFYEIQLQKLAVNAVIGPLSVMYDCFNDELLCNYQVSRSMRFMLKEISMILHRLPEVSRSAKRAQRFNPEKLESIIVGVLGKTGKNSTKMREAVRKGDRTDIDFYNGYLVKRAAELRIDCPHLEMMLVMVKGKQAMKSKERNSLIPFKV